jgi:hypothetical protein
MDCQYFLLTELDIYNTKLIPKNLEKCNAKG